MLSPFQCCLFGNDLLLCPTSKLFFGYGLQNWLAPKLKCRGPYCARTSPLPLLPSGPGGVGGITSRRTRHTYKSTIATNDHPTPHSRIFSSLQKRLIQVPYMTHAVSLYQSDYPPYAPLRLLSLRLSLTLTYSLDTHRTCRPYKFGILIFTHDHPTHHSPPSLSCDAAYARTRPPLSQGSYVGLPQLRH